jgi:methionyl-tRNA formyltransferase
MTAAHRSPASGSGPARRAPSGAAPGLRVLLYVGRYRAQMHPDIGGVLIRRIRASRHVLAGVVTIAGDPLAREVAALGVPVFPLIPELDLPAAQVKRLIADDDAFGRRFARWLRLLAGVRPDIGLVFGGGWVPTELARLPPRGFLNYHPGPLPELRGFESDTFAVLEGRAVVWGTVHYVSDGYDEGAIVGRSARLRLGRHTTPVVVLHGLIASGVPAVVRALDRLAAGRAVAEPQDGRRATSASRARARRESTIRWETDDCRTLHRRLLAFCGQDIPIRLKAAVAGATSCVRDLEAYEGDFPGRPGELIGHYRGAGPWRGRPIVRTTDGAVVLELGSRVGPDAPCPEEPLARLIPPRRRRRGTTRRGLLASLDGR